MARVRLILALAATLLVAAANAQKIVLNPSPATFQLTSGMSQTVSFTLNAPIICPDSSVECSVVVRITNGDATAVSINTCLVKWLSSEWSQVRTITITARPTFVDDSQRTIILTTSPANSTSPYYHNFDPADITLNTARRRSSQCSATGDPHYTTFDGFYWNFYEVAQNVVYRSTAVGRTFEIQARLWGPPYAKHCALAGREENDMVIVDGCGGSPIVTTRFSSPAGLTPRVVVSGSSYYVYFNSGAYMGMDWGGWGFNVYFTAPGQDFNKTLGMCGNNNGNPNDDATATTVTYYRDLLPTQQMTGRQDLWTWYPPATTTQALPPYSQLCSTLDTPVVPILNNPGGIDITNQLTPQTSDASTQAPFIVVTAAPTAAPQMMTVAQATAICSSTILNSSVAIACAPLFVANNDPNWADRFVSGCVEDISLLGYDPAWISSSIAGLQSQCATLATQQNASLSVFCPTSNLQVCSGHGACTNNVCACTGTFTGPDCSIDSSLPPVITAMSASTCDVLGLAGCPSGTISISGTGFINSANLTCRYNTTILMSALYLGTNQVLCSFPTFQLVGQKANLMLQVSNNLKTWSNSAPITYYNSRCLSCTAANACTPQSTSCNIDGQCIANGQSSQNNPCLICDSTRNVTSWSYTLAPPACWPQFDFPIYSFKVVGVVPANTALGTVRAVNPFLTGYTNYALRYALNTTNSLALPFTVVQDPTNNLYGIIKTSQQIDVSTLDPTRLPDHFTIYAQDPQGHYSLATSSGVVSFIASSSAPSFTQASYSLTLAENTTVGTAVLRVNATLGSNPGPLSYNWMIADPHFAINATTGIVTLIQPLDYTQASFLFAQITVVDSLNEFQTADLRVNVTYSPKPPTNILLSSTSFPENQAPGSLVATLTAVDPGSTSFTYTLSPTTTTPFYVVGNKLYSNRSFDYEAGPASYSFSLSARDETALTYTKQVTITIANVLEAPINVTICPVAGCGQNFLVPSDTRVGSVIGTITFVDIEHVPITCAVFPNATFGVLLSGGVYSLILNSPLEYVVSPTYYAMPVCSISTPNGMVGSAPTMVPIHVDNRPSAPQPPILTVDPSLPTEGVPPVLTPATSTTTTSNGDPAVVVGTVTSINNNPLASNITFSIPSTDPNAGAFILTPPVCTNHSGVVSCTVGVILVGNLTNVVYNSSGYGTVTVTVRATDSDSSKFVDTIITVPVQFVNNAPSSPQWVGSNGVEEMSPTGTVVGQIQLQYDYSFVPQVVTLLDASNFGLQLVSARRRAVAGAVYNVVVSNPNMAYVNVGPAVSFALNVTNFPPTGSSMSAVHTMTVQMTHRAMVASVTLSPSNTNVKTNHTFDVPEGTPGGTLVGTLSVDYFDRASELSAAFTLLNNGDGYFALDGANRLVRSSNFLQVSSSPVLYIAVKTTFTQINSGASIFPFVPSTISYFRINVQPVTAPPALVFVSSGTASAEVEIPGEAIPGAYEVANARFQVTSRRNSALRPVILNDPSTLFTVSYDNATDSFRVYLSQPLPSNPGFYSQLTFSVPDGSNTITGTLNVTILALPILITMGPGFQEARTGTAGSSASIAGIVVGCVVGAIVLLLLVAIFVVRRRKQQVLKTKMANEPFYSQVHGTSSLDNPTYLQVPGAGPSDLGFEAGLANPMYAWYRPDMNRQESEEFLADQIDGAFVIRDSAATPGWHMLAVKTHNAIIHEKIKMGDDGLYELLPGSQLATQPKFKEVPMLVEHYAEPRQGIRYSLALDNPLYDNSHLHKKAGSAVAGAWSYQQDQDAPNLPLKERELAAVQQVAHATEGDEIYTNTEQAKTVISSA